MPRPKTQPAADRRAGGCPASRIDDDDPWTGYATFKDYMLGHTWPMEFGKTPEDRLRNCLGREGFRRIAVTRVDPHPVWQIRMGIGVYGGDMSIRALRALLRRVVDDIGYAVDPTSMMVSVAGTRLHAAVLLSVPV